MVATAIAFAFSISWLPASVRADGGVLEINQTCAIQTGCFSGDDPGFPVSILAAGSYRLTSNLVVPDADTTAIGVGNSTVSNVDIDLGGFEIRGPLSCPGSPAICAAAQGSGRGVVLTITPENRGNSVRNGSITGVGNVGVTLGQGGTISSVGVSWSGQIGVLTGERGQLRDVVATENGFSGILVGSLSTISSAIAQRNGQSGISAASAVRIRDSVAHDNVQSGISCGEGCVVTHSISRHNGSTGISAGPASTVYHNSVVSNGGWGVTLGASATMGNSTLVDNANSGQVTGGRLQGENYCKDIGANTNDQCF